MFESVNVSLRDLISELIDGKNPKGTSLQDLHSMANLANLQLIQQDFYAKNPPPTSFVKELEHIINKYSMENGSNTPDFILASLLNEVLQVFNSTVKHREEWYGRGQQFEANVAPIDIGAIESNKPIASENDQG
jgi:hypothetical protein